MKLKKLLKEITGAQIKGAKDPEITGICSNSKLAAPGNLFIAKKGLLNDGASYIIEAIRAGASAVLTDMFDPSLKEIAQVIHKNPSGIEGQLASNYYKNPSDQLFVVGITGTNGKTTTSFLTKYFLDRLSGSPAGLIGTIEYIIGLSRYQAVRTTPDVISNQKMLREMCNQGCQDAIMEVSSHGLNQGRLDMIQFDVAIFTNLTQDHLDYHENMEAYSAAKNTLFKNLDKSGNAVVNADSPWLEKIIKGCTAPIFTYGLINQADIMASDIKLTTGGTAFNLKYQGKVYPVHIPLVGRFNVYNCLAALGACLKKGFSIEKLLPLLAGCPSVSGRLEPVPNGKGLKIYVDFAHSGDSLENVLSSLTELKTGKIITVFGCGGDRDKTRRPGMAKAAEEYSDFCIVTSDNPRSENPESICQEIVSGFKKKAYLIEVDRKVAISKAIKMATPQDIILIAGKGHETTQIFAHKTIEFDDCKIARELCNF